MSKSLGTGIDPLEMADERGYGADAIRFALVSRCSQAQQDLRFSEKMIADVRNFNTKIWNATRFVLMNLDGFDHRAPAPRSTGLVMTERWIRSRYAQTARVVTGHLEAFEFDKAARALYEFIWGEYCDWYLEMAKVDLQAAPPGSPRRAAVQHTLWSVLSDTMRLLHPVMPFLTEEVWQHLPHDGESIMISPWPAADGHWIDAEIEGRMRQIMDAVRTIRSLRAEVSTAPGDRIPSFLQGKERDSKILFDAAPYINQLTRTSLDLLPESAPIPANTIGAVMEEFPTTVIRIKPTVRDVPKLRAQKLRDIADIDRDIARLDQRLSDPAFLDRAPAEVVQRERAHADDLKARRARLVRILEDLDRH